MDTDARRDRQRNPLVTGGGYPNGSPDPFGGPPPGSFGGPPPGASGQGYSGSPGFFDAPGSGFGAPPPGPRGEVNTLATLSIVFAVVFAPAGAVLGHLALNQIRRRSQRGRERAIIGLTLSYIVLVAAVIALVVWLVSGDEDSGATSSTTMSATGTTWTTPPPPRTTVVTSPAPVRQTVAVGELAVGDCVEVQQYERVPGDPSTTNINIYRTACEVRDGVVRVDGLFSQRGQCKTTLVISNPEDTIFACISDFKG
ncbi:DUF4190 domain-containing protein [Mycolicibacterium neoaurum]|uniref:DUF4190 domain-containing protein n=1 Tax=Mycolicibacterium neoaurum TaxID=1795 RepID=UPI00248B19BA|nr:DUF4190 domain-containing protein [Mycolicibacterium neoaurum]WBS07396.1 DUF4190 domain-containing protein [Mycolicibacterium neoaurum]